MNKRNRFRNLGVLALLLLTADATPGKPPTVPPSLPKLSNEQLSKIARKSVVVIECHIGVDKGVPHEGSLYGSGFIVDKMGMIATNAHVVESCTEIYVKQFGSDIRRPAYVFSADPGKDVAILYVSDINAPALSLSSKRFVPVGTSILAVGHPEGLDFTVSDGIVSALREISPGQVLVQITAPISPGSSGGPVLDHSGQVVGMSTLYLKEGQNLNFAVAANDIRAALDAVRLQLRAKTSQTYLDEQGNIMAAGPSQLRAKPGKAESDDFSDLGAIPEGEPQPDRKSKSMTQEQWFAQTSKELRLHKRYSDARAVLAEGLAKFPSNLPILLEAAELAFSEDNYYELETYARKMLELNPNFSPAHQFLSSMYFLDNRYEEAKKEAEVALNLGADPDSAADAHFVLAEVAFRNKDWSFSLRHLDEAMKSSGYAQFPDAHTHKAIALLSIGRRGDASFEAETALALASNDSHVRQSLRKYGLPLGPTVISKDSEWNSLGSLIVKGVVQNEGRAAVSFVEVIAESFDEKGVVVGTGRAYVEPTTLGPGLTGSFTVYVGGNPKRGTKYNARVVE